MVRPKRQISAEKKTEVEGLLHETREKFKMDLKELEQAKRQFSLAFVEAMQAEFTKLFDKDTLNMKLIDYVKLLQHPDAELDEDAEREGTGHVATPAQNRRPQLVYKTLKTPSGVNIRVPSCITPKVESGMQRAGKFGEVLFSVHGTPVVSTVGAHNTTEEAVHEWLQKEEDNLTPNTRDIIIKLKKLVTVKVKGNNNAGAEGSSDGP